VGRFGKTLEDNVAGFHTFCAGSRKSRKTTRFTSNRLFGRKNAVRGSFRFGDGPALTRWVARGIPGEHAIMYIDRYITFMLFTGRKLSQGLPVGRFGKTLEETCRRFSYVLRWFPEIQENITFHLKQAFWTEERSARSLQVRRWPRADPVGGERHSWRTCYNTYRYIHYSMFFTGWKLRQVFIAFCTFLIFFCEVLAPPNWATGTKSIGRKLHIYSIPRSSAFAGWKLGQVFIGFSTLAFS